MPGFRKRVRRRNVDGTARFLTFSCYRRLPLLRNPKIASRFIEALTAAAAKHDVSVLAWVVMPEHVHLVVCTDPPEIVSAFLADLKRTFARHVVNRWRELNAAVLAEVTDARGAPHLWQAGGGYDRSVVGEECLEKIRYCHGNPVVRGLAASSVGYPFSSACAYERLEYVGPPIAFDLVPPTDRPLT